MKATKVHYEKTFNLGNYSNEVIGVDVEIEEGETAAEAIKTAREYVNKAQKLLKNADTLQQIEENPANYNVIAYKTAQHNVEENQFGDDIPF